MTCLYDIRLRLSVLTRWCFQLQVVAVGLAVAIVKAVWSVRGFFLLQNHVIRLLYVIIMLSKDVFMYHLGVENRRRKGAYSVYTSTTKRSERNA